MKTLYRGSFLSIALALGMSLVSSFGQRAAEVRTISSLGVNLRPLDQSAIPPIGTFWLLNGPNPSIPTPPSPFPPQDLIELGVPVYSVGNGQYIVDDSQVNYASLQSMRTLLTQTTTENDGPPNPAPGGGGGGGGSTNYFGPLHGTNDLWLEVSVTNNALAYFVIHTPATNVSDNTNYDLFATTNIMTMVSGLNATNWVWLFRTESGQTNNLTLTNLWPDLGFFRLGTMLDSDGDGLTDAYEQLVSHTDPANPDMDNDGLPDGYVVNVLHSNPFIPRAIPTLRNPFSACTCPE